jgi:hypothetical protein
MQKMKWLLASTLLVTFTCMAATPASTRRKESRLPANLPNPLVFASGKPVTSAAHWPRRRAELLRLFTKQMYGRMPPRPAHERFRVFDHDTHALGGLATRTQITILLNGHKDGPRIHLLLYTPNGVKRPPVILGMNFWGNETINADPGIRISTRWVESEKNPWVNLSCVQDHRATAGCRGINSSQWPLHMILSHGYAIATFYRGDLDRDRKHEYAISIRSQALDRAYSKCVME